MFIYTAVGNLHNIKTNRYHPILFRAAPAPSGAERSKSKGHHTIGFDTREDALEECRALAKELETPLCIEKDFVWEGDDIPAMVAYFDAPDEENNVRLLM